MSKQSLYKKYSDVGRLNIWGEELENGKRPRMAFGFRDGNPRVIVYTGEMGTNGIIPFGADLLTFGVFLEDLKNVIESEPGTKFTTDSLLPSNEQGPEKLLAVLHVGKTKEGIVYLSVISEGKPKLVFTLKPSKYHRFRDSDKNILSDDKISVKMATALHNYLYKIVAQATLDYMKEEYTFGPREAATITGYGAPEETKPKQPPKGAVIEELEDLDL